MAPDGSGAWVSPARRACERSAADRFDGDRVGPDGFRLLKGVLPPLALQAAQTALLEVATRLGAPSTTLDQAWTHFRLRDRRRGGLLYNAAKLLPQVHALALAPELLMALQAQGLEQPALVDVNFRIDSIGEDRFLFDWHQDYWFSMCSPRALVAWIPLAAVTEATGGVELMSLADTGGRILKTAPGGAYASYADAIRLDEPVPAVRTHRFTLNPGDVLLFRFDVLHRSLPVASPTAARWTLQARFADLADPDFLAAGYRPAQVRPGHIPYLQGDKTHAD